MVRRSLLIILLMAVVVFPSVAGQCQEEERWRPDYMFADFYSFAHQDSVKVRRVGYFALDWQLGQGDFYYEFKLPAVAGVKLRARENSYQLTSTFLVFCGLVGVPVLTAKALGEDDLVESPFMKIFMASLSPRLVYRPSPYWDAHIGYRPEFILFTDNDGVLLEVDAGIRITPFEMLAFTIEASRFSFWGIDQRGRDFGWGFGIGFSLGGGPLKETPDDKEQTR